MKKYKYPPAGEALMARALMSDADWLTDEMRTDIADDVRLLRNAIAASVGGRNLRQRPTSDRFEQSSAYGGGHDKGDSLLVNWFRENRDLAGPSGILLPTFEMADRALKAVLLPPAEDGKQRSRYEKMSAERRRAYGIPDGYLNQDKLNALAWAVGLPPGYLLLQFRVDRVLVGREWQDAPIREWLRDAIGFQLRQLGVEPWTPEARPEQPSLVRPPKAAAAKPAGELTEVEQAALDAVLGIQTICAQVGGPDEFFKLFGGPRGFEQRFGTRKVTQGKDRGATKPNLPHATMQGFLRRNFEGKSAYMVRQGNHLPNQSNTARLNELIALLQPLMPAAGQQCDDGQRAAITAIVAGASATQATLFDDATTPTRTKTEDDPGAPGGLQ